MNPVSELLRSGRWASDPPHTCLGGCVEDSAGYLSATSTRTVMRSPHLAGFRSFHAGPVRADPRRSGGRCRRPTSAPTRSTGRPPGLLVASRLTIGPTVLLVDPWQLCGEWRHPGSLSRTALSSKEPNRGSLLAAFLVSILPISILGYLSWRESSGSSEEGAEEESHTAEEIFGVSSCDRRAHDRGGKPPSSIGMALLVARTVVRPLRRLQASSRRVGRVSLNVASDVRRG